MKNSKKILAGILAAVMAASVAPMTVSAAWKNDSGKWSWTENGREVTGWKSVEGNWYYFDGNGDMATGWRNVGGKWYYMNQSGAMTTGWQSVGGKWYYLNASGDMATGWKDINGQTFHLDASGAMSTGWIQKDGKWCYLDSWGPMAKNWRQVNGTWYHMDANGYMETGFFTVGDKTYFASASGAMQTGVVEVNGEVYYFGETGDGAMKTGKVEIDGKTYNFGEDGQAVGRKPEADVSFDVSDSGAITPSTPEDKPSGGGSVVIPPRPDKPDTTKNVDSLDELKAALNDSDIKTVNVTGDITLSADETITVPSNKKIVVKDGVTLTLGDFDAVAGKVVANAGSSVKIVDWDATHTMIGDEGLNVTSGAVDINFGANTVTTIPVGTVAEVKGTFMDAGTNNGNLPDAYRVPRADEMVVNGTLNVNYKMEIAGTMTVNGTVHAKDTDVLNTVEKAGNFAGKVVAYSDATIAVEDNGTQKLISKDTLSADKGQIEIEFAPDHNEITIPVDTVANVKGTYMDSNAYRLPKADKMFINGTLNVEGKMEVSGDVTVDEGADLNITKFGIFETLTAGQTEPKTGTLENNDDVNNNGTLILAKNMKGDGSIWTTSGANLKVGEKVIVGTVEEATGAFELGENALLQTHIVGENVLENNFRKNGVAPGKGVADTAGNVTVTLSDDYTVGANESFGVYDNVTLKLTNAKDLTLKAGSRFQIYGTTGAQITNVSDETVLDMTVVEGVLGGQYYDSNNVSFVTTLTGGYDADEADVTEMAEIEVPEVPEQLPADSIEWTELTPAEKPEAVTLPVIE